MWASARRSFASRVGSHHGSGRNSWWSSRADPAGVTPTRKTPTWQLSSLPSRPLCCRDRLHTLNPAQPLGCTVNQVDAEPQDKEAEEQAKMRAA